MKPREWWICCNVGGEANKLALSDTAARSLEAIKIGRYPTDEVVHVIEKSAYDRLEAMCEKLATVAKALSTADTLEWAQAYTDWMNVDYEYRAMRDQTKMPCPRNE